MCLTGRWCCPFPRGSDPTFYTTESSSAIVGYVRELRENSGRIYSDRRINSRVETGALKWILRNTSTNTPGSAC